MDESAQRLKRAQSLVGTSEGRPEGDYYPTPAWATQSLLNRVKLPGLTWEPACGDGAMSKVLIQNGYEVFSTDLINRGYGEPESLDFITYDGDVKVDNVCTNPPYSLALEFVEKSFQVSTGKVCMFLKLAFLEGSKRWTRLANHYPTDVYVFAKRPQLTREGVSMKNSGMIAFAWFVWEFPFENTVTRVSHIHDDPVR